MSFSFSVNSLFFSYLQRFQARSNFSNSPL